MNITLTDEQVEEIVRTNLSMVDAVEFLESQRGGIEYALECAAIPTTAIPPLITFDNCHEVARGLYMHDAKIAEGFQQELTYWTKSRPVGQLK